MDTKKSTTPTYLDLQSMHRVILTRLQGTTGRTMRSLVTEAIEDMAVKYELVKETQHIFSRTDWLLNDPPGAVTTETIFDDQNKYMKPKCIELHG